jgi:hypothetical protein
MTEPTFSANYWQLVSAERIFPPEHNPSTNTRTYGYQVR